jgi:DNA-binding NarL/FixJ family response regulator
MAIRVLLADDHQLMREGLRKLIDATADIRVVAEAEDGAGAVDLAKTESPDVILMDVSMPNINGIQATRQILTHNPDACILALSNHSTRQFVTEMLNAGASGYLLKSCAFDDLVHAIRAVADHHTYISPSIPGIVFSSRAPTENGVSESDTLPIDHLTPREREVLRMVADGNSIKEIAMLLNLSTKTVEAHRRQLMEKLHTESIADLTKIAIRAGLTCLE